MNIIAVDDEKFALQSVLDALKDVLPDEEAQGFRTGAEAKEYALKNPVDVALLDVEMRDIDGVTLAKELKLMQPKINIIFTTGYSEYIAEAMSMHASGYLLKPITAEKIAKEFADLRHPVEAKSTPVPSKKIVAKAFGTFELYKDQQPIEFKYSKSKELMAYLIDRNGAMVSNNEVIDTLWEDDDADQHVSYFKNLKRDIKDVLDRIDCKDVLVSQWGKIGVRTDLIDCDYLEWLSGSATGINAYHGEYMLQYSWAEFTNGRLDQESYKYDNYTGI